MSEHTALTCKLSQKNSKFVNLVQNQENFAFPQKTKIILVQDERNIYVFGPRPIVRIVLIF
jgi:hypothetical protein